MLLIAQRIHGLPKALMEERLNLSLRDQSFNRLAFKHLRIFRHGFYRLWIEDEEPSIDPSALVTGLFLKGIDLSIFQPQCSEPRKRLNTGQRNQFLVILVKRNRSRNA